MSSDEADQKNVDEISKEVVSSAEENEEKEEETPKEDKVNNKAAAKKKGAEPPKIKQPPKKRVKSDQEEKDTKKNNTKESKKKAAEQEEEDEEEEDEESGEENDTNHKPVPLLDQPLEITGKRRSKVVERFKPIEPEEESKEVKIPEGKGKVLGEIERIEFNIQRAKPEDLKLLHRLCFGKPGKAAAVKKTLKKFNGFEYNVDSEEFKKKKEFVDKSFKKVTVVHLKNVCNILDIERSGSKDELIERILKFITCPVDSGKKLPGGGRSKRKGASNKNYEEGEESHKSRKKSTKAKKKEDESEESEKEDEDDEEEEEEKEKDLVEKKDQKKKIETDEESDEEKEEEEEKPKKGAKKGKKAFDTADKKAPPKKRAAAKKAAEKKSDSEAEADGDDDSEDDEPLAKKSKAPPTDEEIKTYVKSLLEGANLELITMKKVCQDVYAHYPDFDLAHKKDFIKTTVKNLISS
ncbi:protein DEK-like isoform X1 [Macrosteles quadrilineatus]|uniref:protein DEK-like isoform X1 n=1 Tax=Macrosteles quadrilineatus TaxID=74068 RepID=UPI0023E1E19C|nr:protein DEK-like isoform X1 [Macrosteles quadrilineatus]